MPHSKLSRRKFAKRMILGSLAIPIGATAADEPKANDAKADKPADNQDAPQRISEGDLLLGTIMVRYPDERLDEKTLTSIRMEIERNLHRSREISRYPLKNSDAPAFHVFAHESTHG